jgi:hypothetical protein
MPPKTQKIVEKQQSQEKSLYVFLVSRIFIGGILFRIVISVSGSESFPLSSPDGIDGKGPSGAPANLNVFISEFCLELSGMGCRIFKGGIQKLKMVLPKNQHTQKRKYLNFENWCSGELSKIGHHFSHEGI